MAVSLAGVVQEIALPILEVEQLTVQYGSLLALDAVDLQIRPGEAVALAGENGAGKSTLVRCIAGDLAPSAGRIFVSGERVTANPAAVAKHGVAVVWQDLALCNNLDIAANLLLGQERSGLLFSETRFHAEAALLLDELEIDLPDTRRDVQSLSSGQRQLVAVARALHRRPRLLVLDEPTGALGVNESARVEQLAAGVREQGASILLVSHDIDQMFRLADQIAILRHGRLVARLETARCHPDDVVALITGQQTDSSARRQLSRLHSLADRLATADPSSSLPLIVSALAAALGTASICIHLVEGSRLRLSADLGLPQSLKGAWAELPLGSEGGPVGLAAAREETMVDHDIRSSAAWAPWKELAAGGGLGSSWAVPVIGSDGSAGVITVFRRAPGYPARDELNLVMLYAGFAASAVERERLLGEVTERNRVLETIREVLEMLAGPVPFSQALLVVLHALCEGLQADEVGLFSQDADAELPESWVAVNSAGERISPSTGLLEAAASMMRTPRQRGGAHGMQVRPDGMHLGVPFEAPQGPSALVARWAAHVPPTNGTVLMEDAANSLRLAHERQESERARREASALRRSQELQRDFLSRLSHELRTPLTAIGGYASSLMQSDVTWDGASKQRFLSRIGAESARLNRLVDDLLDFSAIESSTLRLHRDWCDLPLVLDAAVSCVAAAGSTSVELTCNPDLPVIWADHDRLEQVFVNLLDNALRHNPAGTRVRVAATCDSDGEVVVSVTDNGSGMPDDLDPSSIRAGRRRSATAGAGLGLSIVKGIVAAHDGSFEVEQLPGGTCCSIRLPVEQGELRDREVEERDLSDV